ncbi:FAM210A family protein [Megaselia abdita]
MMTTHSVLRFSLNTLSRRSFTRLSATTNPVMFSRHLASSLLNQSPKKNPETSYSHQICAQRYVTNNTKKPVEKTPEQLKIEEDIFEESSKLGLFARFKLMYKKYWYVLIPVHCVTSIGWLGGFYYMSKSGVDVPSLLQAMHISETIIEKMQNSDLGHLAIAYLCYKVATPVRYAVTLGGTTVSIKYLVKQGHIKPVPTKEQLIKMYEDKKTDLQHKEK